MRVLVTGAAGFIGHHVAKHLEDRGHEVVGLVRCGHAGSLKRLQDVGFRGQVIWHDLRSPLNWTVLNELGKVDACIHMGAETHVDRSISNPTEFVVSNVLGTVHLMEWAACGNCNRFIYFSTDEVFGPSQGQAYREWDPHNPRNPYAATKSGAEQMVKAYENTYKLNACVVRGMNVFGERQHPEKWVPMIIRKVLAHEAIQVHANPSRTKAGSRFYIYAGNVAKALEFILGQPNNGPFHVVGEREVDNLEMVHKIACLMGEDAVWELVDFHSSRPGHDLRYAMEDNNLAGLGWVHPMNFDQSLETTVKWYLDHKEWL